jgi:tRNA uridine 5-carbamoylmethylation protein Kti12
MTIEKCFFVFCGLPCSGKTHYRKYFVEESQKRYEKVLVLSTDDYIEKVALDKGLSYNDVFWDEIKNAENDMNQKFGQLINPAHALYRDYAAVIWDQTNLTVKKRKQILDYIPRGIYYVFGYYWRKPETFEEFLRRVSSRPEKYIPENVLITMYDRYEYPKIEEGFTHVTSHSLPII